MVAMNNLSEIISLFFKLGLIAFSDPVVNNS